MLTQIQIHPDPSCSSKEKGDFFEALLRSIMETQRYRVTEQVNFTGTEIDLLCEHLDRPDDNALVECKARLNINASDIKNFAFDVLVTERAKYGFFVHTSELQHQAAGMVNELKAKNSDKLIFWGPEKIIDLLQHCRLIKPPRDLSGVTSLTVTKRILLYTYLGRFWITVLSNKIVPTHYYIENASSQSESITADAITWVSQLDELQGLSRYEITKPVSLIKSSVGFDTVAEIQEAEKWDDYRPVGAKFFVGRTDIRHHLYQFILSPLSSSSNRRVFFVEGKSGWGKSSLIAELRARSHNKRNKNTFYVMAVDSRSANTAEFVSLAIAKLVTLAAKNGFVPKEFSEVNIVSNLDLLASETIQRLLSWLTENKKILVVVFDQFEDVFRKEDLFRAFHKLMLDANEQQGPLVIGFSWKSEINIPIDNPAYSLWQQARDIAEPFRMEEFLGHEVDRVLRQLEMLSGHQLPADLKRRLKESSQGYPWLTKKLSIHCYHQMNKGMTPEDLVDQNLNVDVLLNDDMENLTPSEARALRLIAKRGYVGDPFDIAEIDDKIPENEIHSLLHKRLIVRSGGKYNVYWDIFRDFLVEERVPSLGESFLLRQYPEPCVRTLQLLLDNAPCSIDDLLRATSRFGALTEGTALNQVRELRHLGVVVKVHDEYRLRPNVRSLEDFREHICIRLKAHVVVRSLGRITADFISHEDVVTELRKNFRGYGFAEKTWSTYASYLIAWLRYAGIDFGKRLGDTAVRSLGLETFIPQWRPDKDIELLISFRNTNQTFKRSKSLDKGLYDLKALGMLSYQGQIVSLSKRGLTLLKMDNAHIRGEFAKLAMDIPKIGFAYDALRASNESNGPKFEISLAPVLSSIPSLSYKKVASSVLKSWAKFIDEELKAYGA